MLDLVAKKLFLTKGIGVADDKLTSFEFALRQAGIAGTNIVLISSIFPPNARLVPRKEGLKLIKPGQILFSIYSRNKISLISIVQQLIFIFEKFFNHRCLYKGRTNCVYTNIMFC